MTEPRQDPPALADWWPRAGAAWLDGVALCVLSFVAVIAAGILAADFGGSDDAIGAIWLILWAVLTVAYQSLLPARKGRYNGQSLGKQVTGIRVVRDDGRPVTPGSAFVRDVLVKIVPGIPTLGLWW